MKRILGNRGTGKSTKIIEMAVRDDATIIVPTIRHIAAMEDLAKKLGCLDKLKCITFSQYKPSYCICNGNYYIDELDACLSSVGILGYSNPTLSDQEDSEQLSWAKREIEYALDREAKAGDFDEDGFNYAKGCYESALKAYASLCEDDHSGMSISITTDILNRLIKGLPLTPIENREEDWEESWKDTDGTVYYRNKRVSSLFKVVNPDGTVEYDDVNAYECVEKDSGYTYHGGGSGKIFHKYFPVTFPYYPPTKKYRIITRTVLYNPENGDFDTKAYLKIVAPDGEEKEVNLYFGETENGWQQIDEYEFYHRCVMEKDWKKGKDND